MKIYTKRGDEGKTSLLYGGRISKADSRCDAYGTIDEAVSALGLARSLSRDEFVKSVIKRLQRELFVVGAELATDSKEYGNLKKHFDVVTVEMVIKLEKLIDQIEAQIELPKSFIIPGASPASSALDLARSILRRGERRVVQLKEQGLLLNDNLLKYLNRLSDLLFMLARYEDRSLPFEALSADGR